MTRFRDKVGALVTSGRMQHALFGAGCAVVARLIESGGAAVVFGAIIAFVIGGVWELLTPIMAGRFRWQHPYGDLIDWLAYPVGAVVAGVFLLVAFR